MSEDNTPKKQDRDFDAYAVRNDKNGKGHFHKVGAAFAHKDGQGYDIDMVAAPTNGRLTLRTPKDRLDKVRDGHTDAQQHGNNHERG